MPYARYRPTSYRRSTARYGPRRVNGRPASTYRSSAYSKAAATKRKRAALPTKARRTSAKASTVRNARAIARNYKLVKRVADKQWGDWQAQSSHFGLLTGCHVLQDHPIVFHVNDPGHNNHGPRIFLSNYGIGHTIHPVGLFNFDPPRMTQFFDGENESHHLPNGPRLMLRWAKYTFRFNGFVQNTHIRIDFVRERATPQVNPWRGNDYTNHTHLPYTAKTFSGICDTMDANYIDPKYFHVLKTKHLYMNSMASSNTIDHAQDRRTSDPTTSNVRECTIFLRLNKVCTQLSTSISDEADQHDNYTTDPSGEDMEAASYTYANQDPHKNIFCIISSNDKTDVASVVTGNSVNVEIQRRMCWQDAVGAGAT